MVVSPHSDDGVLSVGGFMSARGRAGEHVELLTVFALDPESEAETIGWDRRGGFPTEREAARGRREEDRRACAILGVTPRWLPFGSVDYDRHGDEEDVLSAITTVVDGAELVLVPGSPLTHPDHAWLASLLRRRLPPESVALYAEQPYTLRERAEPFAPIAVPVRDRIAKWRAIRRYRTQLPLLKMRRAPRRGPHRLAWTAERIAWPDGYDGPPH